MKKDLKELKEGPKTNICLDSLRAIQENTNLQNTKP